MVKKLCGPNAISANELHRRTGVHQQTLSRWLKNAKMAAVSDSKTKQTSRRPKDWTAEERFEAVVKTASMDEDEIGAYLRRNGLKSSDLDRWKESMLGAVQPYAQTPKRSSAKEKKRIRELERELRRKDKALAEASALLVLKKKAHAIWGDLDDDTP